ncbi:hypothetical protein [Pontibacter sp. BAB1700]|uniref:hypothetical protein n=1 Tax=Pontibacter sp. BAB1700 TaxID=1144253 RepID=UPI00026BD12C|nr:hypothetical protein [Pontibacter sp. BAB1700]EJF11925.1 hypothetical protein O71_00220 [Pontibacter sp. BAB1700]
MWIASKYGFFSIVAKDNGFHVRARVQLDLEELLAATGIAEQVQIWPGADYRYRIIVGATDISKVFSTMASSIDYSNFKSMIDATPNQLAKRYAYSDIWCTMYQLQEDSDKS